MQVEYGTLSFFHQESAFKQFSKEHSISYHQKKNHNKQKLHCVTATLVFPQDTKFTHWDTHTSVRNFSRAKIK